MESFRPLVDISEHSRQLWDFYGSAWTYFETGTLQPERDEVKEGNKLRAARQSALRLESSGGAYKTRDLIVQS